MLPKSIPVYYESNTPILEKTGSCMQARLNKPSSFQNGRGNAGKERKNLNRGSVAEWLERRIWNP